MRACVDVGLPVADFEYGTADEATSAPPVLVEPRHGTAPDGHDFRPVLSGDLSFAGERLAQRYVVPNRSSEPFRVGDHPRATEETRPDGDPEPARVSRRFVDPAGAVADPFDL